MYIGLISHLINDYNLGCSALAISNIKLMDEVLASYNVDVEYVVILAEPKEDINLEEFTSLNDFTKNKFSYSTYPRLKPILKNPILLKKTKAFENLDFVIDLCGGDGYTDNYGMIRLLAESLPIFGCKLKKTKCFFAPQTIGPFNTVWGRMIAKKTLKELRAVFVRDVSSHECCKKLGVGEKTIQVIDVAFALPFIKQRYDDGKFHIGINVSGLLYNGGYNHDNYFNLTFSYKDFIHRLIETLLSKENIQIHLVPHVIENREGVDDDYSVCKILKEKYPLCELPNKFTTASEAKSYISAMNLFTGARMHSTIGAISSGVPVIPVAYSRKFNGLYDTLGYPYYIDAKADITIETAIVMFCNYMENIAELAVAVKGAEEVYHKNLAIYKNKLAEVLRLTEQK